MAVITVGWFSPFNLPYFSVSRYQTSKTSRYVTLSHAKMHLAYSLMVCANSNSFSDTLTTLEIKTCVALRHGTLLRQHGWFFLALVLVMIAKV